MTVSGGTLGSAMTFTISAASNTFTHSLTYSFGGASGTILSYVAAGAHTWTPPITLANQIPNAVSGTVTFTLYTFAPGTQIGTKTYTAKLTVPASVKPVVSAVTATEATSGSPPNLPPLYRASPPSRWRSLPPGSMAAP